MLSTVGGGLWCCHIACCPYVDAVLHHAVDGSRVMSRIMMPPTLYSYGGAIESCSEEKDHGCCHIE